jgi:hypothetical protein
MIDARRLRLLFLSAFALGALQAVIEHAIPTLLAMDIRAMDDGRTWIEVK